LIVLKTSKKCVVVSFIAFKPNPTVYLAFAAFDNLGIFSITAMERKMNKMTTKEQ
jgi:hypothetical protein